MSDYEEDGNRNDLLFLLIICSKDYLPSLLLLCEGEMILSGKDFEVPETDSEQKSDNLTALRVVPFHTFSSFHIQFNI